MTPEKHLFSFFLISIRLFIEFLNLRGNLMYLLLDNGLEIQALAYSPSIDSVIQPDPSII